MIGVILCTHSDFAKGLRNAVEMIAGEQSCFDSFCFMNGDDVDELSEKIAAAAQRYIDQKMPFCILVDMFAATPFNASLKYTAELWRLCAYRCQSAVIAGNIDQPRIF